ncbi:MAG: glycosyltransferase family 2 protein [Spirochaetota bacterium]
MITGIILGADVFMILLTYVRKHMHSYRRKRQKLLESRIADSIASGATELQTTHPKLLLRTYIRLSDSITLKQSTREHINNLLVASQLPEIYIRKLQSLSYVTRCEAAYHLKYVRCKRVQEALLTALKEEKRPVVVLYLSQALATQGVTKAIAPTVNKLSTMNEWYAQRIRAVLYTYGKDFLRYARYRTNHTRIYMQKLICGFAIQYPAQELLPCLKTRAQSPNRSVRQLALQGLLRHFPEVLRDKPFADSSRRETLPYVIRAYGKTRDPKYITTILSYSRLTSLHKYIVNTLSEMATNDPELLTVIYQIFEQTKGNRNRTLLSRVLANKVEYYLTRINTSMKDQVISLIKQLVAANHMSAILLFLNRNHDREIETSIVEALAGLVKKDRKLREELRTYLNPDIYARFGLPASAETTPSPPPHTEPPKRFQLSLILTLVIIAPPLIILLSEFPVIISANWNEIGRLFVVRFNYLLVFYSLAINTVYLLVLCLSAYAATIQSRLGQIKDKQFLFTPQLLPSVSIIAPAYNEGETIIESTSSLLNQRYPDYELIIVNDGSADKTLDRLISHFKLEKQDILLNHRLNTRKMRGVYANRHIPNLIVVDKVNGGKADSLNLGLNISSKEFFCGIDSDSLLEPEALLTAISVMIDSPEESVAAGGNIYPINGCQVDQGVIEQVSLPKKFLPRLQSLEYLRAFMSGRVGWAYINTLMIISGAFGIFDREQTIKTGGYLTKSGKFHKDTVGEDMELVVRISRHMREKKLPYSVDYAFNANCWTEVPESWKALHRQRDRWHRGLIDIILFHSRLIANPAYGRLGMVGMLYYVVFEFIGPLIEIQGLLMVGVSALIGALHAPIALMLFSSTILLGILVSITSVFISEYNREVYGPKDVAKLLVMGVIENFGVRQLISAWRVGGYFSAMKASKGWGAQTRKGFSNQQSK